MRTINTVTTELRYWENVQMDFLRRDLDDAANNVYEQHISVLYEELDEIRKETA